MKGFAAIAIGLCLSTSAALAQISVQSQDGSTVTIGPGGINVNDRNSGSRSKIKMNQGGIQIDSANGANGSRVIINTGSGTVTDGNTVIKGKESARVQINEGGSRGSITAKLLKDLVLNDNHQTVKGHCDGNEIVVNGNHCDLQLTGKVGSITINGNHNVVRSERVAEVVTNGNSNTVTWSNRRETPDIADNGKGNSLRAQ